MEPKNSQLCNTFFGVSGQSSDHYKNYPISKMSCDVITENINNGWVKWNRLCPYPSTDLQTRTFNPSFCEVSVAIFPNRFSMLTTNCRIVKYQNSHSIMRNAAQV